MVGYCTMAGSEHRSKAIRRSRDLLRRISGQGSGRVDSPGATEMQRPTCSEVLVTAVYGGFDTRNATSE